MADSPKQRASAFRRELQRLIAISFSAGELSKYAERWRVFTDREGGSEGGARAIVRALEARGKLGALVDSLRAQKPLVEWPDPPPKPTVAAAPVLAPKARPDGSRVADTVIDDDLEDDDLEDEDEDEDDEDDEEADEEPRAASPRGAPLIDPYMQEEATAPARRVSPLRGWLPAIATGIAGIAIGATGMYLLHPERKSATPTRIQVAELASSHLRERVEAFAAACQTPAEGDSARDVLGTAFAECGVPEIKKQKDGRLAAPPTLPSPTPPAPRPRATPRRPFAKPKPASGTACLDACHGTYTSCAKARCGPEPKSAQDNAAWSRCLHDCQSRRSRCRLACR